MTGGEVRDPVALGVALKDFFDRYDLPRKNVRLGLANSRVGIRQIDVSDVDDETQLPNAISFRAHENAFDPDRRVRNGLRHRREHRRRRPITTRSAVVTVAYRESIDRYLTATSTAGLDVMGIDFEAFALLRALAEPAEATDEPAEKAVVAVCVGHERTTLAVSDGITCSFARVLDWGGENLTNAVARGAKISPVEAEAAKRGACPSKPTRNRPQASTRRLPQKPCTPSSRSSGCSFASCSPLLRFYQSQTGSLALGEILLSGGTTGNARFRGGARTRARRQGRRRESALPRP